MADHADVPVPRLPLQQGDDVAGRIKGVHDCKGLSIWGPPKPQGEHHGDEALHEGLASGDDQFPVLDSPYLQTSPS